MTFQLDTTGSVGIVTAAPQGGSYCQTVRWGTLDAFTQGYIEALFAGLVRKSAWGSLPMLPHPEEPGAHREVRFSDLAPEALARIIADCTAWVKDFVWCREDRADRQMGASFWRCRQNKIGNMNDFPPLTVQLGDDGKVRFA